jgi:hypothetical protein
MVHQYYQTFVKHRSVHQVRGTRLNPFYELASQLRSFFPPDDINPVYDRWFDQIGCTDSKSIIAGLSLATFLPHTGLPRVFDSFVQILDDFPLLPLSARIVSYLGQAIHQPLYVTEPIDWTPYLDRIFLAILRLLSPSVEIGGRIAHLVDDDRNGGSLGINDFGSTEPYNGSSCGLIAGLIVDGPLGALTLGHVRRLMAVLQPVIGFSDDRLAASFVTNLVHAM